MTTATAATTYRLSVIVYVHRYQATCDSFVVTADDFDTYAMDAWGLTTEEWLDNAAVAMWGDGVPYIVEKVA